MGGLRLVNSHGKGEGKGGGKRRTKRLRLSEQVAKQGAWQQIAW